MARQALEFRITRKGRHEATIEVEADPANPGELRQILTAWLEGERWHPGRWREFEAVAFEAGGAETGGGGGGPWAGGRKSPAGGGRPTPGRPPPPPPPGQTVSPPRA